MGQLHKVFISFHHGKKEDPNSGINWKNKFVNMFSRYTEKIIDRSVEEGDINTNLKTETIRQKIRDEYLKDSSVTIVLIGPNTWQRKHVDWEIGSSIRHTQNNYRSGLLGIFLPSYPLSLENKFYEYTIPPRLYDNWKCGYAKLYRWIDYPQDIQDCVHQAYLDRKVKNPDNKYPSYVNNRSGERWYE